MNEVVPVLNAGRRPPVGQGFAAFIHSEAIERAAAEHLDRELNEHTEPYDSHPSLAERVAAMQDVPAGSPDDSPSAASLVRDSAALEAAQAAYLFGDEDIAELRPIDWDAVGGEVYLERARGLVSAHGELLGPAKAGGLDGLVSDLGRLAGALQQREPELPVEHARDVAAALIANGLLVALEDNGWSVEAPPAEPVICRRGEQRVAPHVVVDELRDGSLSAEAWHERAAGLGISELALQTTAAAA